MTISASSLVRRATDILLDNTSVRWPVGELVRWLNDAQRDVLLVRADAINRTATMTLAAGTRQSLKSVTANATGAGPLVPTPIKLIEIPRNMAGSLRAVRLLPRQVLDAQMPNWHTIAPSLDILHYLFDPRDPTTFYTYPPAADGAKLEVSYSAAPVDIVEPAEGSLYTAVQGDISLPDSYGNVLLDLMLYRAYSKDAEFAGNETRAANHRAAAIASLGAELAATLSVQPQFKPGNNATKAA